MVRLPFKIIKKRPPRKPASRSGGNSPSHGDSPVFHGELKNTPVSPRLDANLDLLQYLLGTSPDVTIRRFRPGISPETEMALVFLEGLVDKDLLGDQITRPLMLDSNASSLPPGGNILDLVKNLIITAPGYREMRTMDDVVDNIFNGCAALFTDGRDTALMVDVVGPQIRQTSEPTSEMLIRGPKEGFVETLRINISMIRRRLKSPNLVFEEMNIGAVTCTRVAVAYIKGLADPGLVAEVKSRLDRINVDGILESGYIEEFIEDNPYSPFPQTIYTERPDKVAANLLEGRVAILTDGTPFALVAPASLISFLQAPDDYYQNFIIGTAIRWLRYAAFALSLLLPSLYIAITTFHQEMIPTRLLISLAASREGVPIPAALEALLMELTFEALREAGIRLPRAVGQAVSIVGALVVGQSAVQAGIVSSLMVIVVALTGIASFMNPVFSVSVSMRLLRFPMMLLAATLGLFGVMAGILALLIHLAGLRSFGVPYLSSLAPLHLKDLKDVLVRAPWWAMRTRPVEVAGPNPRRQAPGQKPGPPKGGRP